MVIFWNVLDLGPNLGPRPKIYFGIGSAWPGLVIAWPGLVMAWPGLVIAWPGLVIAWPGPGPFSCNRRPLYYKNVALAAVGRRLRRFYFFKTGTLFYMEALAAVSRCLRRFYFLKTRTLFYMQALAALYRLPPAG